MANINTEILSSPSKIETGSYKKTKHCFYFQSKLFEAQITELFDNLWPTVTAIKNLRWQVNGYYHETGVSQNVKLVSRFVDQEDKTNRPNLYRTCIEQSWEQQESYICKNLLTNLFAIYEGWIETLLPQLDSICRNPKDFQFPTKAGATLLNMQSGANTTIVNTFYNIYASQSMHYNLRHLNNYLSVYRYFKECRNSIIHNGGFVDQKLVNAYTDIKNLTTSDLDVSEVPFMYPFSTINDIVKLNLRGVVGFSQILMKIVTTLDIEFIKAPLAESCFIRQVKEFNPFPLYPSPDNSKMKKMLDGIMNRSGFLPAYYSKEFCKILKTHRILRI